MSTYSVKDESLKQSCHVNGQILESAELNA